MRVVRRSASESEIFDLISPTPDYKDTGLIPSAHKFVVNFCKFLVLFYNLKRTHWQYVLTLNSRIGDPFIRKT